MKQLSVCMIARNEAELLPGCLESLRGIADEVIIVDTGSTDSTPEIAQAAGATLLRCEWTDDFSAARNVSLKAAGGKWVLWMDADERLRPSEHEQIRVTLARTNAGAFLVPIHNVTPTGSHVIRAHRLFRNRPEVRFTGRIHEQVFPSLARIGARIETASFTIEHLGYKLAAERMDRKNERNLRILSAACDENPAEAFTHFNMAQTLMVTGRYGDAEGELRIALGLDAAQSIRTPLPADLRAAAWNNLSQCALERGDVPDALRFCAESLREGPQQVTAHLMAWRAHAAAGEDSPALAALRRADAALHRPAGERGAAIEVGVCPADLQHAIGQCCLRLGVPADAAEAFGRALDAVPGRPQSLAGLARAETELGRMEEALDHSRQAAALLPQDDALLDLQSLILLKLARFDEAASCLYALLERRRGDITLRRRLAGVLVRAGKKEEACSLLLQPIETEDDATSRGGERNPQCALKSARLPPIITVQ